MKQFIMNLLVLSLLMPLNAVYSQDEYMLEQIKGQVSKDDQKRIEKAEKYLTSANEQMKAAKDIEDGGKNKNKALNKKISGSTDIGSAHKIIYDVYIDYIEMLTANASSGNVGTAKKNAESALKLMKEAKKKREASLRTTVLDNAYELLQQASEIERKAIKGLSDTYLLLSGKKANDEKVVKTEPNQISNKQVVKKEPDNIKKQPGEDKNIKKNEPVTTNNNKVTDNQIVKKEDNITINNADEDKDIELSRQMKEQEKKGVFFKIQIAASKSPLSVDQLNAIYKTNEIFNVEKEGEWYKYSVSQRFKDYDEALAYKNNLKIKGIFIVAYKDGNKVTIEEALKKDEVKKDVIENKKIEPTDIKTNQLAKTIYRLQIGISTNPMSAKDISEFKNGGKPVLTIDHGGWYSYTIGDFNTEKEALNFKKLKGLNDADVVKFINGKPVEE
jgi:hypothetical protein